MIDDNRSVPNSQGIRECNSSDYERAEQILEAMRRDGVDAVSTTGGGLVLQGPNADGWKAIVGRDTELIENYINGVPFGDPGVTVSSETIHRLMQTYGINPSMDSKQLHEADIRTHYLVENCLVAEQHGLIAGPSKAMKTSVAIDLAISLARARRFLGEFWVPDPVPVLFLSAESGAATIQETARRVAKAKGLSLDTVENVHWNFWVPRARNPELLDILEAQLVESAARVLIADPTYLMLDGESQGNLSANGEQIQAIVDRCKRHNVTAILIDHTKRGSENTKKRSPLQLDDVSGAGKAENFRQWMLIGRRKEFDPNEPIHQLWLTIGGSAGHSGLYQLEIDERRDDCTRERAWAVVVERNTKKAKQRSKGADASEEDSECLGWKRPEENPFA